MTAVDLRAFPGHSPSAPLDLDSLTTAEFSGIVARLADHSMTAFTDALAAAGNCSHPVRLVGSSSTVDARTGEVVTDFRSSDQPLGMLFKPCGNRRADVCPACSRVYARDMYEVISTGLHGGKGVPETVARNPLLFVTLTGPSFGHVHGPACERRRMPGRCAHGRPLACYRDHDEQDRLLGSPVCWACYDWRTAALWQWHAPELWRRFTITLRRALADVLGVAGSRLRNVASVQYAKVAEFQARGIVHFHALIRLDGPGGSGSPAPLPVAGLVDAVEHAARSVRVDALPAGPGDVVRTLRFGPQLDVRIVRTDRALTSTEELSADAVAGYLAKYSTKSSGYDPAAPKPHLDRLARACRDVVADALAGCGFGCGDRARAWRPRSPRPVLCGTCRAHPYALLLKWSASCPWPWQSPHWWPREVPAGGQVEVPTLCSCRP